MRWRVLVLLPLGACAALDVPRDHSPLAGIARVLALDLSSAAASRRAVSLARVGAFATGDVRQWQPLHTPNALLAAEVERPRQALDDVADLAQGELARRPTVPEPLLPSGPEFGQDLADGVFVAGALVVPSWPLPEIDDRRHRTDPQDDRPEASWWQRLRRRLRL